MRRAAIVVVLGLWLAAGDRLDAQSVVAPTPDRPSETSEHDGYTVSNSFETGYRFSSVGGADDVYRASVNYGNGLRLLEGELRIDSIDGKSTFLDEFSFRTRGAPTDPYQSNVVRAAKHGLYRYDMQLRVSQYRNRLPALWNGEHSINTERTWQVHDLTLFPGKRFEILLGFDRNKRTGPGFSSEGIPDSVGAFDSSNFLRYRSDLRQVNNQYRAGVNFRAAGLAVTAIQSLDNYKEDSTFSDASALPALFGPTSAVDNVQPISDLRRAEPFHGSTPVTQVAVRTERERWIGFHGRFAYSSGNRNSVLSEDATAVNGGASTLRQTFVFGSASRKQGTGDFTVTLLPTSRWTVTNTTAVNSTRIEGGADFLELSLFRNQFLRFESLGIRHITNASEASFRPVKQLAFYGAYRFSTRRIRTREAFEFPDFVFEQELEEVDNDVHAGAGGLRWTPGAGIRFSFDFEAGRADQPLTPVSEKDFHNERLRLQWRRKGVSLSAFFKNEINNNPTSLGEYSSAGRSAGFQASWAAPKGKLTLDGGYSWLDLDTSAGIFNLFEPGEAARTLYASSIHNVNFSARTELHKRAVLYLGYSLTKDTGNGGNSLSFAEGLTPNYPSFSFDGTNFLVAFPLTYQSPQGRLSIVVRDGLSWNFGWQYYGYSERFSLDQSYRAHVGYSSLRWSF